MANSLLKLIKRNPGIDTRVAIDYVAKLHNTSKQRIAGFLSALKRSGQIHIVVIRPGKESKGF